MYNAQYIAYHILYNIHHILYTSPKIQIQIFDLVEFEPNTLRKHPNAFAENPHMGYNVKLKNMAKGLEWQSQEKEKVNRPRKNTQNVEI
jgi:hypothetical protein